MMCHSKLNPKTLKCKCGIVYEKYVNKKANEESIRIDYNNPSTKKVMENLEEV
ncbi:MAG: hypothetical protein KJ597_05855 [Nanoarchaeota archaeon]|nr:hypothetical protein [Nanoarchaeota archaeon]